MLSQIKNLPKGEIEITVATNPKDLKKAEEKALADLSSQILISGFRPGKAPSSMVKTHLNPKVLLRETLNALISTSYQQAIEKHRLVPVTHPQIQISSFKDGSNSYTTVDELKKTPPTLKFIVAVIPPIKLGDYQKALQEVRSGKRIETAQTLTEAEQKAATEKRKLSQKAQAIGEKTPQELEQELEEKILDKLLEETPFELPEVLVREEAQRKLSSLREQIEKLGLSLKDYLKIKRKKSEELEKDLEKEAEKTVRLRLILGEIAKQEKISLEKEEDFRYIMEKLKKISRGG